jgi:hypothetical protein
MKRPLASAATLLVSLSVASSAFAQMYPPPQQGYPPAQGYPPQQQYPQQQYPQQQYPQQGYQQPYQQPYVGPTASSGGAMFGSQGQLILSADRLFGLSFWSAKLEHQNNNSDSESGTAINLLWGDTGSILGPYSTPRLSADFTVANNISLGGSIAFVSRSGKTESTNSGVTTSVDDPTVTGFAFAPRFGYILGVNQMVGVWFKGGVTYFSFKEERTLMGSSGTSSRTSSGFSLNLEPELVVLPVPHFGFTVSGLADIALSGNFNTTSTGAVASSTDESFKINNFGLALGILGFI